MDLLQQIKEEKLYWSSVSLLIISIILFICKVPYREIIVLGSFIFLAIVLMFKVLK
jgi:hypothetical protein